MATASQFGFVTPEQYLKTVHEPDCELVNGYLEERNVGEYEHSRIQYALIRIFGSHEMDWKIRTLPECRMQVSASNYRVPDVMVLRAEQKVDRIVREAPLVCVEVLSPEDTLSRMQAKIREYVNFGVQHIWAFDPELRLAYRCDADGFHRVNEPELTVPGTAIRLAVAEVFAVLD